MLNLVSNWPEPQAEHSVVNIKPLSEYFKVAAHSKEGGRLFVPAAWLAYTQRGSHIRLQDEVGQRNLCSKNPSPLIVL